MTKSQKLLTIAKAVAMLSKDESTKVGAVIIGPDGEGGPWGYNGAPRGCVADEDGRKERPEKYWYFEHGERNAIYTAARTGFSTVGCSIVVTHPPCMDCARAIVQAGIKRVIVPDVTLGVEWAESTARAMMLFRECGVEYEVVE